MTDAYPVNDGARPSEADAVAEMPEMPTTKLSATAVPAGAGTDMSSWFRQLRLQESLAAQRLNVQPMLWFFFPTCLFFACVSAFLEYYVVDGKVGAHFAVFTVGSYIVFSSYFVCDYFMTKQSTSYASIPDGKKFYVLSNLIKSAVLFSYCPLASQALWMALVHDTWSTQRIRNLGVLYAIPDFVSLFLVSRMALTTKVHHVCVVIFMVYNLYTDYSEQGVGRALVVYAVFSTFAYLVNLLLASRFLRVSPMATLVMSAMALVIYAGCLVVNWAWQIFYITGLCRTNFTYTIVAYVALIALVVYDDIVLVKWLWNNMLLKWKEKGAEKRV